MSMRQAALGKAPTFDSNAGRNKRREEDMKPYEPCPVPTGPPEGFYAFTSFVGGFIRHSCLFVLVLWFGFAASTAAVGTVRSLWQHIEVRSLVAKLESRIAAIGSPGVDHQTEPQLQATDIVRIQREENRARRKLAYELRQRKASAGSVTADRRHGSRI
jgi:hypothetical protein